MESQAEKEALTEADMEVMRKRYGIPEGVRLRIPSAEEKPWKAKPGEICLHPIFFENGLRLPFHPFVGAVMSHIGLVPAQMGPTAWLHIVGSIILWQICSADQDHITLDELRFCYHFRPRFKHWFLIPRESNSGLVLGFPNIPDDNWSNTFFFVSGDGWQCSPGDGTFGSAPQVPTKWHSIVKREVLFRPLLSDLHLARVYRAFAFDKERRNYLNLITPENIDKYVLNNVPSILSPSLANASLDPSGQRKRRDSDMTVDCPSTTELGSDAGRKFVKRSESSTTQTDPAQPKPGGFPRLTVVESSSSEGSVQICAEDAELCARGEEIVDKDEKVQTVNEAVKNFTEPINHEN